MNLEIIKQAADVLRNCKYVIVLTGAGISTESGIPDFRSPISGLWAKVDPEDFTIQKFQSNPQVLYQLGVDFFQVIMNAQPNPAHMALGELEKADLVKSIVTQNIDGLHQKGGSKNVFEVHGSLREGCCLYCQYRETMESIISDVRLGLIPPLCKNCGEPMKPDVTLFGEAMPPAYHECLDEARKADGMLVVGSSLLISPANLLPNYVSNLVIINHEETHINHRAQVIIKDSATEALPLLKEAWIQ